MKAFWAALFAAAMSMPASAQQWNSAGLPQRDIDAPKTNAAAAPKRDHPAGFPRHEA